MRIWVDADACPRDIKDTIFIAAENREVETILVAHSWITVPTSDFIRFKEVAQGADAADQYILEQCEPGDLVISQDIPLAAELVAKGVPSLTPRGTLYTEDNVGEALAMRDMMETLRGAGQVHGGPPAPDARHMQQFANELDRFLTRALKNRK